MGGWPARLQSGYVGELTGGSQPRGGLIGAWIGPVGRCSECHSDQLFQSFYCSVAGLLYI